VALLLLATSVGAQETGEQAWYTVLCPVAEVEAPRGRVQHVVVARGTRHGLANKRRGRPRAVRKNAAALLGYAEVESSEAARSRVRVTLADPAEPCRPGDVIEFACLLPKVDRGVLWDLASLHLQLTDVEKKTRFLDFDALVAGESAETTRAALDRMVAAIRRSAPRYARTERGVQPIASGRFKGRMPQEIAARTTRDDLLLFFRYVTSYPGNYIGQRLPIEETYGTWLTRGAPYSPQELADELTRPGADARALLAVDQSLRDEALAELLRRARVHAGAGRADDARKLIFIASHVREGRDEPAADLNIRFSRAVLAKYTESWSDASLLFADTIVNARRYKSLPASIRWVEASAQSGYGDLCRRHGKLELALRAYRACAKLQTGADTETRAETTRIVADLLRDLGEYGEATKAYATAIDQLRAIDALDKLNEAIAGHALAQGKLGRTPQAIQSYRMLKRRHKEAGNWPGVAAAQAAIGAQYWNQGSIPHAIVEYQAALKLQEKHGTALDVADTKESLSILFASLRNYKRAKELNAQVRRAYREANRPGSALIAEADGGWFDAGLGEYENGLRTMNAALRKLAGQGNVYGVIFVRNRMAFLRAQHNEFKVARDLYSISIREARATNDRGSLAASLRSRARISLRLQDFEAARKDLELALEVAESTADPGGEIEVRVMLSQTEQARGEFAKAHEEASLAIRRAEELESVRYRAKAHEQKGLVFHAEYEPAKAKEELLTAIQLHFDPTLKDRAGASRANLRLAAVLWDLGDWDGGRQRAKLAQQNAAMVFDHGIEREAIMMQARMKRVSGELMRALWLLRQLEEDSDLTPWEQAEVKLEAAKIAQQLGLGEDALRAVKEAYGEFETLRNQWGMSSAGLEHARILRLQADYEGARKVLEATRPHTEATADLDHVASLESSAGEIALALGDLDAAAAHFERAHATAKKMNSRTRISSFLLSLGACRRRQGRLEEAAPLLKDAAAIFADMKSTGWESRTQLELARLALASDDDEALATALARIETISGYTRDTAILWEYWFLKSRLEDRKGNLDVAVEAGKRALTHLTVISEGIGADPEKQRQFLLSRVEVYESMAALIGKQIQGAPDEKTRQARIEEMITFVDKARFEVVRAGASNVERTGSAAVDKLMVEIRLRNRTTDGFRRKMEEARARGQVDLALKYGELLAASEKEVVRLYDNLKAKDAYFGARMTFNPKWFHEWKRLKGNARIVIYFPGPEGTHYLVYSKRGFETWKQNGEATEPKLRAKVLEFHALLRTVRDHPPEKAARGFGKAAENREPKWYADNCKATRLALEQLHEWLIKPIEADIEGAEPLIFMPYGSLCYLPFEALLDKSDPQQRFLGERHTIGYFIHRDHMRGTMERLKDPRTRDPHYWVGFGDPVGKLKSSRSEILEIGAMFSRKDLYSSTNKKATEKQVYRVSPECTILHFATHGYLNGTKPSETYIELAEEGSFDGRLQQDEIYPALRDNLPPIVSGKLQLVVLSACDTARGAKNPQAEVLGLPENFSAAGSPSVVASLWKVETWSAGSLMAEFYRHVGEGKIGMGLALRKAREELSKDKAEGSFAHPYYWAPFVLFGDWR
jgi:CHAT domain-containing protein